MNFITAHHIIVILLSECKGLEQLTNVSQMHPILLRSPCRIDTHGLFTL